MRVYSGCKPFISDFYDSFSEVTQIQLFYTMFAALAMKVNLDGENLQDKIYFDVVLTLLQFMPALAIVFSYRRKDMEEVRESGRSFHADVVVPVTNQVRMLGAYVGKILGGDSVDEGGSVGGVDDRNL
ncbi:hypothetical protein TrST_g5437 [Triparma strigata]|uniref:Uncharacterized protein n=2 Tax=Triparma TaxID=722752 RepID=A0A9W7A934_9STRA|nr:hypothetical protein TrST_g5437 [Triparma strigata]